MISIATPTFDLSGTLVLSHTEASVLDTQTRRVSRKATLDGGAVILDRGYTDADRDLNLRAKLVDLAQVGRAAYLLETYSQLLVSTERGCFLCAPVSKRVANGQLHLSFHVISREDT